MTPLHDTLSRVSRFIEQWRHGAALIGGLAIVARVRARPTRDVDLIVVAGDDELPELIRHAIDSGFLIPDDVDEWLDGGLLPLRLDDEQATSFGVDLIVADDEYLESVVERAEPVSLGDVELPTATLEDLVLLKLLAERPIDIDDVLAIKDAYAESLDMDYLTRVAGSLGLAKRLALYFDIDQ